MCLFTSLSLFKSRLIGLDLLFIGEDLVKLLLLLLGDVLKLYRSGLVPVFEREVRVGVFVIIEFVFERRFFRVIFLLYDRAQCE